MLGEIGPKALSAVPDLLRLLQDETESQKNNKLSKRSGFPCFGGDFSVGFLIKKSYEIFIRKTPPSPTPQTAP